MSAFGGNTVAHLISLLIAGVAAARGLWSPCGLSMISAINPMAEHARGHRFWLTAIWFIGGAVTGGAVLGLALVGPALLWGLLDPGSVAVFALAGMACLLTVSADRRLFGFSLPLIPRQVNERWLAQYRRWVYAGGFGVQIGIGVATYVMTSAVYLTCLLGILSGSWSWAILVGLTFGGVRGLGVLASAGVRRPDRLRALLRAVELAGSQSLSVVVVAQLMAAIAFGHLAFGWLGAGGVAVVICIAALPAGAKRRRSRRTHPVDGAPVVVTAVVPAVGSTAVAVASTPDVMPEGRGISEGAESDVAAALVPSAVV